MRRPTKAKMLEEVIITSRSMLQVRSTERRAEEKAAISHLTEVSLETFYAVYFNRVKVIKIFLFFFTQFAVKVQSMRECHIYAVNTAGVCELGQEAYRSAVSERDAQRHSDRRSSSL